MKDEIVLINGVKYLEFKTGSYVRLKDLEQTISKNKLKVKSKVKAKAKTQVKAKAKAKKKLSKK